MRQFIVPPFKHYRVIKILPADAHYTWWTDTLDGMTWFQAIQKNGIWARNQTINFSFNTGYSGEFNFPDLYDGDMTAVHMYFTSVQLEPWEGESLDAIEEKNEEKTD